MNDLHDLHTVVSSFNFCMRVRGKMAYLDLQMLFLLAMKGPLRFCNLMLETPLLIAALVVELLAF